MITGSTFKSVKRGAELADDAAEIDALKGHVVSLAQSGALARRASEAVKAKAAKATTHPYRRTVRQRGPSE